MHYSGTEWTSFDQTVVNIAIVTRRWILIGLEIKTIAIVQPTSLDMSLFKQVETFEQNELRIGDVYIPPHPVHKLSLRQFALFLLRWTQDASLDCDPFVCVPLVDGQWCRSLSVSWQNYRHIFHGQLNQLAKQAIFSRRRDSAVWMHRKFAASGRCPIFTHLSKKWVVERPPTRLW